MQTQMKVPLWSGIIRDVSDTIFPDTGYSLQDTSQETLLPGAGNNQITTRYSKLLNNYLLEAQNFAFEHKPPLYCVLGLRIKGMKGRGVIFK